jgi:hypothetical protein
MLQKTFRRVADTKWALIALLLGAPLPIVLLIWLFVGHH